MHKVGLKVNQSVIEMSKQMHLLNERSWQNRQYRLAKDVTFKLLTREVIH